MLFCLLGNKLSLKCQFFPSLFSPLSLPLSVPLSSSLSVPLSSSLSVCPFFWWGCPRGVMVKAMNCGIVVSEVELQPCYYVHFRTDTLGERYEPPYPPSYGLNSTSTVLLEEWLWHWITHKGWYAIKQRNQTKPLPSSVCLSLFLPPFSFFLCLSLFLCFLVDKSVSSFFFFSFFLLGSVLSFFLRLLFIYFCHPCICSAFMLNKF